MLHDIYVEEYSLVDFVKKIEELVRNGWTPDYDTNEGCPSRYGHVHTARMKPFVAAGSPVSIDVVKTDIEPDTTLTLEPTEQPTVEVAVSGVNINALPSELVEVERVQATVTTEVKGRKKAQ
jgi:hypothetical protein